MPHVVQLDLSDVSTQGARAGHGERHWLLRAIYGRDLLKAKLRAQRPDMQINKWAEQRELDDLLEGVVDALKLRDWPEPRTTAEKVRYVLQVLKMMRAIDIGAPFPHWGDE